MVLTHLEMSLKLNQETKDSLKLNQETKDYLHEVSLEEFVSYLVNAEIVMKLDGRDYWELANNEVKSTVLKWKKQIKNIPVIDYLEGMLDAINDLIVNHKEIVEWDMISIPPLGFRLEKTKGVIVIGVVHFPSWSGNGIFHQIGRVTEKELLESILLCGSQFIREIVSLNDQLRFLDSIKELQTRLDNLEKFGII